MKKNKKAFSIIEVITATIILTIAVFGVFKLIGENQKLINNSDNYRTATSLFTPLQECIKNIGVSAENKYINLENCSDSDNETGITIDNISYVLYYNETEEKLTIKTDELNLEQEYK